MASPDEVAAMRRALALATRGGAATDPNPNVGCLVLDSGGELVGEGWHERVGGPHAEVVALRTAGERAKGGTAVVTLEPCAHTGRTPPCTDALVAAGIARVVFAVADPHRPAAGGAQQLRAAGIDVEGGVLADEAEATNRRWLTVARYARPYTTWKYAASLDGRVAAADGTSTWISGPRSRAQVHQLRADCDVIVVGVGTVLADDPHLTTRDADGTPAATQPLRVVVDTEGRTPARARVRDDAAPTWVATAAELGRDDTGRVDLRALMTGLHERQCRRALVEGGPTLAGALLRAGLVDEVVAYLAPLLLGDGPGALASAGVSTLDDAYRWDFESVQRVGADIRVVARPLPAGAHQGES